MRILKLAIFFMLCSCAGLQAQFKVIGYLRVTGHMVDDLSKVDLSKVTHLNIAFINPDTNGVIHPVPGLDTVVSIAHQNNVKVLLSCGGGSRHAYFAKILAPPYRKLVIKNFLDFVDHYQLDGIDVDIEGEDIDTNYESFVLGLGKPLHKKGKLLTAAVAYYTRNRMTGKILKQYDFINMMAYDKTGPWRPSNPGQHAPMSYVLDHMLYWGKDRDLPAEKLVVGLPFYGYGFGASPDTGLYRSMQYKDIVATFPGASKRDEVELPGDGGTLYYNGIASIKEKTAVAVRHGGGVMIWHLLADTTGNESLLNTIHETIIKNGGK